MGGIEIVILYIASLISVGFGSAVVSRRWYSLATWSFFLVTLFVALWSIGIAVFLSTIQPNIALGAAVIYYIAAAGIAVSIFVNALSINTTGRISRRLLVYSFLPFLALAGALVSYPSIIVESVRVGENLANTVVLNSSGYLFYSLFFMIYFSSALLYMYFKAKRETSNKRKMQFHYSILAYLASGLIGMIFNLLLPAMGNYDLIWIGPIGAFVLIPFVYVSIAYHGLYDMKEVAVRSIAYIMTLLTLSAGYYVLALIISTVIAYATGSNDGMLTSPLGIVLALALAYGFQPIKSFFNRMTDHIFFRASYDPEEFTVRLGRLLTSTVIMDELLERTSREIARNMKASHATFVIFDKEQIMTVKSYGIFRHLPNDLYEKLSQHTYDTDESIISVESMVQQTYQHTDAGKFYRTLGHKNVSLLMPLHGNLGYLLLGEQQASGYTQRDLRVLDAIVGELSIAVQNALSVRELSQLNTTLQQRIDAATSELRHTNQKLRQIDATKDEFISMASHQLRTPLTSIKGYLSMVIDGDVGDITKPQKEMLTEAYTSSERMVHLIGDFLNVSRLQTGKFMIDAKPIDLSEVVQCEVDSMQRLAASHEIKIEYKKPHNIPMLELDVDKLRQVIMNLIDNAIYYSPEGSTIKVRLTQIVDSLQLEVSDEGMGVPEDVQSRLFTKFFRAENARKQRPDGTGIGLYLAKKVVAAHGGDIIFRTKRGKGSVFGFSLPIKKLAVK